MTTETGSGRKLVVPASGTTIDPVDPDPDDVRLRDVALGLANQRRFSGQTDPPVNVAQHSINVARQLERNGYGPRHQCYGLLHDAAEAYTGDVPRPIRRLLVESGGTDALERAEERFLRAIWDAFDLRPPTDEEWSAVTTADRQVLAYEISALFADEALVERALDSLETPEWGKPLETVLAEIEADADLSADSRTSRERFVALYEDLESVI